MKSIEELQADVQRLYQELEERRKMEQEAAPQAVNFGAISSKAQRYAIEGHPMAACDEHTQQMYLMILLSVAAMDDTVYTDSFCTIYRIAHGMRFEGDVQELFLSAQQMNFEKLDECTRLFLHDEKRLLLMLECMMVAGTFEMGKRRAMEYIAELCILMKLTEDEMTFLSNLARVVLTQDIKEYKCEIPNTYGELFECYLKLVESQLIVSIISARCSKVGYIEINDEEHKILVVGDMNPYPNSIFSCPDWNEISISYENGENIYDLNIQDINDYMRSKTLSTSMLIERPVAIKTNSPLAYSRAQKKQKEILKTK